MTKPKIILKNVKTFQGTDGIGLNADVWINGIKCISVHDAANGSCYDYHYHIRNNPKAKKVEANIELINNYIQNCEPKIVEVNGKNLTIAVDMDSIIDECFNEWETQKFIKVMNTKMKQGIIVGNPDSYRTFTFTKPLSEISTERLQLNVDKIKAEYCTNGNTILNNNLAELNIIH